MDSDNRMFNRQSMALTDYNPNDENSEEDASELL